MYVEDFYTYKLTGRLSYVFCFSVFILVLSRLLIKFALKWEWSQRTRGENTEKQMNSN